MQLQPASLMQPQEESRQHLHLSLLPDFHLNVKATSLLGSRAKLQGTSKSRSSASACDLTDVVLAQIFQSSNRSLFRDYVKRCMIATSGLDI
jgi:hypothetical protein